MRPQDPSVARLPGPGPHYPQMHPRYHQQYGVAPRPYGPHMQGPPGPYPSSSAHPRHPYNQQGPHMARGPRPEFMGPRQYHPMHLQQQLQVRFYLCTYCCNHIALSHESVF